MQNKPVAPNLWHGSACNGAHLPVSLAPSQHRYMRELPVSAEHLLENLLDPAHVYFAHHGVIGRRSQ